MATTRLSRTVGTPTLNTKYTLSFWLKRSRLSYSEPFVFDGRADASNRFKFAFQSTDKIECWNSHNGSNTFQILTNRVFRDVNSWYHFVLAVDTTQGTDTNRVKLYVNGVQETSLATNNSPSINEANNVFNESGAGISVGAYYNNTYGFDGLLSHVHFCDGQQLAPTVFGSTDSTTGEWKINTSPSFTLGNNGFTILKDGNTITDQSSNSNDFSLANGTLTKTEDCPSNVFPTMNRISPTVAALAGVMGNGNLWNGGQSPNHWQSIGATMAASSGKFYWEFKIEGVWGNTSQTTQRHGIANYNVAVNQNLGSAGDVAWTDDAIAIGWQNSSGVRYSNSVTSGYGTYVASNILMFAMDLDNLKLYLGKNGVWENSGNPESGSTGTGAFSIPVAGIWCPYSETKYGSDYVSWNCGNGDFRTTTISSAGTNASGNGIFEYNVPTGYTALSTKGLNA